MSSISRREVLKAGAATAVSPALISMLGSTAHAADPYADAKLIDGEPPKPAKGSFTIAVLPDTQNYSERHPETYKAQTAWIAESKQDRNIACVLHLGDITNNNAPQEWQNAQAAMKQLDGAPSSKQNVTYFMVPGNHDYSDGGGCRDRTTLLNDYFTVGQFQETPNFGGVYDKEPDRLENSYHTFSAEGRDFLVIAIEFGPRKDVVRWASEVAAKHKDRAAILITHAYMYYDDTRYDWKKYGKEQTWNPHNYPIAKATGDDVCDGEELWNLLVGKHDNFILTLNGHVLRDGLARLTSTSPAGRKIEQILVNYQMRPHGGDGWLRLLEFRPDGKTVEVFDYSPVLKQRNEGPANRFSFQIAGV
jgi:predicted phosphodiesterase